MSCIKRYLEDLAEERSKEDGISFLEAMEKILEEANQDTNEKETEKRE